MLQAQAILLDKKKVAFEGVQDDTKE